MSTWIHITNLPLYYDDYGLQDIFCDIGQIIATNVTKNDMILKSTGFVQFANAKHAKLAASKKDQTVIANSAVRVYLVWCPKEDLSTIKVVNIPPQSTEIELEKEFNPYGRIVDIRIIDNTSNNNDDDQKDDNNKLYALISFCRVDYALQAVQEMNNNIIGMGDPLSVTLCNPDARNLKWKRNSFEYQRSRLPDINSINYLNNNNNNSYHHRRNKHHHHHHRSHHHHQHRHDHHQQQDQHYNKHQYAINNTANNANNIIIVNNIHSIHNNDDDAKHNHNDRLLHPSYRSNHRRHHYNSDKSDHNRSSHHSQRGRGRNRSYRYHHNQYNDDNNNTNNNNNHHYNNNNNNNNHRYHHNNNNNENDNTYNNHQQQQQQQYQHHNNNNNNNNDNIKQRKPRKYRSSRSFASQSTLLGPLYNSSNGQYKTYSVTPSPTRSAPNNNNNNDTSSNEDTSYGNNPGLQRMNSADSTSSNSSVQSLPTNYNFHHNHRKNTALSHYGLSSKQKQHHSPQPYQPQQQQQQQQHTPTSPASTVISTPSTTHSMPTPTGYTHQSQLISRSKTPTALSIPTAVITPTALSNSTTTPVSTPPSGTGIKYPLNHVFTPQTMTNTNALNGIHGVNMNMNMITNGMNAVNINANTTMNLNGLGSPTMGLSLPLHTIPTNTTNKSPQSMTSPILLTPQQKKIIQQQLPPNHKINTITAVPVGISPPNMQQPFIFTSPPTANNGGCILQGPFNNNTPPQPQKRFVFDNKNNNGNNNGGKKEKKSPSHPWTKEEEQIGNKLYKIIQLKYPQRASKIVGMMLTGHSINDIRFLMERPSILMVVANDYNEKQRTKELNKNKST